VRAPIDFGWVHRELRRTGVTLQLLWLEYRTRPAKPVVTFTGGVD
jgi:transposase